MRSEVSKKTRINLDLSQSKQTPVPPQLIVPLRHERDLFNFFVPKSANQSDPNSLVPLRSEIDPTRFQYNALKKHWSFRHASNPKVDGEVISLCLPFTVETYSRSPFFTITHRYLYHIGIQLGRSRVTEVKGVDILPLLLTVDVFQWLRQL